MKPTRLLNLCLPLIICLTPTWKTAASEAYQLLRGDPAGYADVVPGKRFTFPQDHLAHPDYRIEWWYLTANLKDESGAEYAVHWTLFRQSLSPDADPGGWSSNQAWMGHAALSTPEGHVYKQQFSRGGIGQAGVAINQQGHFEAWLNNDTLKGKELNQAPIPGQLTFTIEDFEVSLQLDSATAWVLQGDAGYSQKSSLWQASYYYSQPHLGVSGRVTRNGATTHLAGKGWLDREWSSQPLAPNQPGWDWLSVHLDDGHALMVYRLRQTDGEDWVSGSWINPEGKTTRLTKDSIIFEPIRYSAVMTGEDSVHRLPLDWRIELPKQALSWTVAPRTKNHWLNTAFPYWEGPVTVEGSTFGQGFLELTGYPAAN